MVDRRVRRFFGDAANRYGAPLLGVAAAALVVAPAGVAFVGGVAPAFAGSVVAFTLMLTGLHLIAGVAGLPSLGQAGFAALGALLAAQGTLRLGLPAPLALLLGAAAVGLLGALAAPALCRLAAPVFAGATLALGALAGLPAVHAPGLLALPPPEPADPLAGYAVGAGVALIALLVARRLTVGEVGTALLVAGTDPRTAAATGIDAPALRRRLFGLGALLAGFGGGVLVQAAGTGAAGALDVNASLLLLAAIVLGRPGSLTGALLLGVPLCLLAEPAALWAAADPRLPWAGLAALAGLALWQRPPAGPPAARSEEEKGEPAA